MTSDGLTHFYPTRTDERRPGKAPEGFTRDPEAVDCTVCLEHLAGAQSEAQGA